MNSRNEKKPDLIAAQLKREWNRRSASERAKFYIASHPGWQNESQWAKQAQVDANFVLLGLDEASCQEMNVLEIGCGDGRLVPFISPKVRSYTGIDICPTFIETCKRDNEVSGKTRFFETPGAGIPPNAQDKDYGFIFAAAVFIHCPLSIIESYLHEIRSFSRRETRVRFQVLADPNDLSEIIPVEALDPEAHRQSQHCYDEAIRDQESADENELVDASSYRGHCFEMAELRQLLATTFGEASTIHIIRFDPLIANCEVTFTNDP